MNDKFLICEGLGNEPQEYLLHLGEPSFLARVEDIEGAWAYSLPIVRWFGEPPTDPLVIARIMSEAGEFMRLYEEGLDRHSAEFDLGGE